MKWMLTIAVVWCLGCSLHAQDADKEWYFFSFKHLQSTVRHEAGVSIGAHWTKSRMLDTYTEVEDGVAYPEPVFTRAIGIMAFSYEPKFRLVEYKSNASLSLDIPVIGALSIVDVLTGTRKQFSPVPPTKQQIDLGIHDQTRDGLLGGMHAEAGALLSLNVGQGSTIENTKRMGLSVSAGAMAVHGPLLFNFFQTYERSDYKGYLSWITPVARLGVHVDRVALYYALGVLPVRVNYQTNDTFGRQSELTNTYNRVSIAVRLGR